MLPLIKSVLKKQLRNTGILLLRNCNYESKVVDSELSVNSDSDTESCGSVCHSTKL